MKYFSVLILLLLFPAAHGRVFTLWPYRGGGTAAGGSLLNEIPGLGDVLHTEKMTVNGLNLEMTVSAVNESFPLLLEFLRSRFEKENLRITADEIKVAYKLGDNYVERWLFVNSGPGKPVTVFRVVAPEKIPVPKEWPADLPALPAGCTPVQVVHFPGRKASYGSFRGAGADKELSMRQINGKLKGEGWVPVGKEGEHTGRGSGDIYIQPNPRRILWVDFGELGAGAFYTRPF